MPRPLLLALPVLVLVSSPARPDQPPTPAPIQKVEVKAPSGTEQRRNDTAGRLTVTRAEITRYGDTSLAAVLKRQPGISVVNGEARMRGLGAGYTQLLIDGEPAPAGFTLDGIAPSMIERIEVMRNGSAEFGTQAIAGTINVIMTKKLIRPQHEMTLGAGSNGVRLIEPSASLRWADKRGALGWSLNADLSRPGFDYAAVSNETGVDENGVLTRRSDHFDNRSDTRKLSLAPSLTWSMPDGDSVAWKTTLDRSLVDAAGGATETLLEGHPTDYPRNTFTADSVIKSLRSDLTWTHRTAGNGKLLAKVGVNRYDRAVDYLFMGRGGEKTLDRSVISTAIDNSTSASGKYLAPLGQSHSLGIGWDGGRTRRTEQRVQRDTDLGGRALRPILDEDFSATVDRLALFVQDEWAVTPRLQAYLGLRWEGLETTVSGRTLEQLRRKSSVLSPVAQLLWRVPGSEKDQLRLALSRTYKAPTVRSLVPRRYTTNNGNGPTTPDFRGNPELRPELAWGIDGGYESYFGKEGVVSVSAYARRVQDVTLQESYPVEFLEGTVWMASPVNKGRASVAGLEADAKFPLNGQLDVRANAGYNWSRLHAIAGPDNRLSDQVRFTANVGADYRPGARHTIGANLNLQVRGDARLSPELHQYTGPSRSVDVYGVWKMDGQTQLRLSVVDLFHWSARSHTRYDDGSSYWQRNQDERSRTLVRLVLEQRL